MRAEVADLAAALGGGVFTDPGAAAAEVAAQLDHAEERLAMLRVRGIAKSSMPHDICPGGRKRYGKRRVRSQWG